LIRIIDYKAGNAPSVMSAVKHLGFKAEYARNVRDLSEATCVILPGVGSAKATMASLNEMNLLTKLEKVVLRKKVPFLGVCVGMQILFDSSEEEDTKGLGWFKGRVVKFDPEKVRVPQMGWNKVDFIKDTPVKTSDVKDANFYYVNSYHAVVEDESDLWGVSDYGGKYTACVQRENIYAIQFHAEISGDAGLTLIKNFLEAGQATC